MDYSLAEGGSTCFQNVDNAGSFLNRMLQNGTQPFDLPISQVLTSPDASPTPTPPNVTLIVSILLSVSLVTVLLVVGIRKRKTTLKTWFPPNFFRNRSSSSNNSIVDSFSESSYDGSLTKQQSTDATTKLPHIVLSNANNAEPNISQRITNICNNSNNNSFNTINSNINSHDNNGLCHSNNAIFNNNNNNDISIIDNNVPLASNKAFNYIPNSFIPYNHINNNNNNNNHYNNFMMNPNNNNNNNINNGNNFGGGYSNRLFQMIINEALANLEKTGETPLHLAARYSRADAAQKFLEDGADPNAQDHNGLTPLHAAIGADAVGVFQILLRCRTCSVNTQTKDGTTPLIFAVRFAIDGMVGDLINAEADLNKCDDQGKTGLHWAAAVNNLDAAILLLHHGGLNRDAQDDKGQTPLFLAAKEGSYHVAQLLLHNSASMDLADQLDRLPRDIAIEKRHLDIVRLLDEYSKNPPNAMIGGGMQMMDQDLVLEGAKGVKHKKGFDYNNNNNSSAIKSSKKRRRDFGAISDQQIPAINTTMYNNSINNNHIPCVDNNLQQHLIKQHQLHLQQQQIEQQNHQPYNNGNKLEGKYIYDNQVLQQLWAQQQQQQKLQQQKLHKISIEPRLAGIYPNKKAPNLSRHIIGSTGSSPTDSDLVNGPSPQEGPLSSPGYAYNGESQTIHYDNDMMPYNELADNRIGLNQQQQRLNNIQLKQQQKQLMLNTDNSVIEIRPNKRMTLNNNNEVNNTQFTSQGYNLNNNNNINSASNKVSPSNNFHQRQQQNNNQMPFPTPPSQQFSPNGAVVPANGTSIPTQRDSLFDTPSPSSGDLWVENNHPQCHEMKSQMNEGSFC